MIQRIPDSCCWLRLDGLRLHGWIPAALSPLSQLSNLQSLYINSHPGADVSLEAIANMSQLQLLSLFSLSIEEEFEGLSWLPTGITNLQLNCCRSALGSKGFCLLNLSLCPKVSSLNMSHCLIRFGEAAQVVNLHHIKVLVLEGAVAEGSLQSVIASLKSAKQLQELNLCAFRLDRIDGHEPNLQLESLLSSLQSFQKLDVTSCRHMLLGPSEYTHLKLHSFACQYSQLSIVEAVPFNPFSQSLPTASDEGNTIRPSLRVEGVLWYQQNWVNALPVTALTHLTIQYGRQWLLAWSLDFEVLPNLLYLDITLLSYQSAGQDIRFPIGCELQELYIRNTQCAVVDSAGCTNLTSLGITYAAGYAVQDLSLPTSLERLCLYNVLREGAHPKLHLLSNLEYLKVGAQATVNNYMNCLPRLPASLLKLDLLGGGMTNLGQLTLLTRLKKLGMPVPPNTPQMSVIKQLRQLRHVSEASGMEFLPVHTS